MAEEPTPPPPLDQGPPKGRFSTMEDVADKFGFVPNVRKSDNLLQARIIGGVVLFGALLFALLRVTGSGGLVADLLLGALAGLIAGLLISGAILAVIGLKR